MDTFRIENYEGDAIDVTWKPLGPAFDLPSTIVFVGSFRSEEGSYKEIKSAVVKRQVLFRNVVYYFQLRRSDVSLKECCEMEFPKSLHNGDCARMCEKHSIVEALSSALEHCKSEIYKLQRCYHTGSVR
jgi:RNAse (barnase) inhibitor barstar